MELIVEACCSVFHDTTGFIQSLTTSLIIDSELQLYQGTLTGIRGVQDYSLHSCKNPKQWILLMLM